MPPSKPEPRPVAYGTKVAFRKGSPIPFADFTLTHLGERRIQTPPYPRGILILDFTIAAASSTLAVSWSAGTGDICPTTFVVANMRFSLELGLSDRLGALRHDELVLTKIRDEA